MVVDLEGSLEAENRMVEQNIEIPTLEVGDVEEPKKEEGSEGSLIFATVSVEQPQAKKDAGSSTPHWLDTALSSKKRNVVLVSNPIEDIVSKMLGQNF